MSTVPTPVPTPGPTPTSSLPPRSARSASGSSALWGIGLAVAVAAGYYLLAGHKPTDKGPDAPKPSIFSPPSATPTATPATGTDPQKAQDEAVRLAEAEARLVPLRARVATLKADGDTVREALARFDQLAADWKAGYEPLRQDEAGKRIAASPTHLTLAATVFIRDRATARQRVGWGERLDHLLLPAVQANRAPTTPVVVTDDTLALMGQLLATVRGAVKEWEADVAVLDAAKAATAATLPAAHTLTSAFEQRLAAERQVELTRVEAARQAALKKQADELAAITVKTVEADGATERANKLAALQEAEHKRKLAELALKAAKEREEAERARAQLLMEYERDLPTIKLTLPAFITSGKSKRQKGSNGPLSLAFIQGKEALEDSRKGMTEFCRIARQDNDRPSGPIPYADSSELSWQRLDKDAVLKAQGLIRKYGAILVEKGLLDP